MPSTVSNSKNANVLFNSKRGLSALSNFHGEGEHNVEFAYMADRFPQTEVKHLLRRLSLADGHLFTRWLKVLQPRKKFTARQQQFWFQNGKPVRGILAQLIGTAAKKTRLGALRRKILCQQLGLKKILVKPCLQEKEMEALMLKCLRKKFQLPKFKKLLLATGDADLHEVPMRRVSRWTWKPAGPNGEPRGGDMLGKLLVQVRAEKRAEKAHWCDRKVDWCPEDISDL